MEHFYTHKYFYFLGGLHWARRIKVIACDSILTSGLPKRFQKDKLIVLHNNVDLYGALPNDVVLEGV